MPKQKQDVLINLLFSAETDRALNNIRALGKELKAIGEMPGGI
jgi:hypothetical protein